MIRSRERELMTATRLESRGAKEEPTWEMQMLDHVYHEDEKPAF